MTSGCKLANLQFSSPLDDNEVIGIAKSIAKWTRANFSEGTFSDYVFRTHSSEIQSLREEKQRWGRPSLNEVWVDLGVSRRTYFRMKSKLKVSGWDQPATNFVIQQ